MSFLRRFKQFYNKENFNFDNPHFSLYEFHPQLTIAFAVNGIILKNTRGLLRYKFIWPALYMALGCMGAPFMTMVVYHALSEKDYSLAVECFSYLIIVFLLPIFFICMSIKKSIILNVLSRMNKEFENICAMESIYRDHFLKGQQKIWQLGVLWVILVVLTGITFPLITTLALIYQSLFATIDENTQRPLVFPLWLPNDDVYSTPNFEMFLCLEYFADTSVIITFCGYIYTLFHFLLHSYYVLEMIIIALSKLFENLDQGVSSLDKNDPKRLVVQAILNRRMKHIVTWHVSVVEAVHRISKIYGPLLVYHIMTCSTMICLMAFQVAEQLENGKLDIRFVTLLFQILIQIWIPCYIGSIIQLKGYAVADACWNCGWEANPLGQLVRLDLVTVMLRAQQPITIKYTGVPSLQLETFSSIVGSAYSYFNMLRAFLK